MPGISLHCGEFDRSSPIDERFAPLLYDDRYEGTVVLDEKNCSLGYTGYPAYPIESFRAGEFRLVFEGYIYEWDRAELRPRLGTLVHGRFDGFEDTEAVAEWVRSTDGEFVLVAVHEESGVVTIVGDCLGRLPLYVARNDGGVAVSREHRFVVDCLAGTEHGRSAAAVEAAETRTLASTGGTRTVSDVGTSAVEGVTFDRLAVAQFLVFGYTLGERTLVDGVKRLPAAPLVRIDADGREVTVEKLHEFDFDRKAHDGKSRQHNAAALAERFDRACRARRDLGVGASVGPSASSSPPSQSPRVEDDTLSNVISLSGGLDSRAVLASYAEQDIPCVAATMDHSGIKASDVTVARELAERYGTEWTRYEIDSPRASDLLRHIRMKDARDPLMPRLLLFFDDLLDEHGDLAYVTGDGGDKVLPDLRPAKPVGNVDELAEYLLGYDPRLGIERVSELTGVSADRIRESIRERLRTYPEGDIEQRCVHFLIYERGRNWLYEAEDTNRCFFWSVTPFYALPFFEYAMNCPDEQKRWYRLYRSLLSHYSENATDPVNANFKVSPGSELHTLAGVAFAGLARYPDLFGTLKPIIKRVLGIDIRGDTERSLIEGLGRQIESTPAITALLSESVLRRDVLDREPGEPAAYSRRDVYLLLTLTSYIDELTTERSALEIDPDLRFE